MMYGRFTTTIKERACTRVHELEPVRDLTLRAAGRERGRKCVLTFMCSDCLRSDEVDVSACLLVEADDEVGAEGSVARTWSACSCIAGTTSRTTIANRTRTRRSSTRRSCDCVHEGEGDGVVVLVV